MARARVVGIAAGFAAALVLAAAWTLLERVQARGRDGARVGAVAPTLADDDGAGLVAPPPPAPGATEREAASVAAAEVAEVFETPLTAGRRLRIVRADDGSPVSGASVRYLGERALMGKTRRRSLSSALDVERFLRWHGRSFRADRDGRLFLPDGERAYVDAAGGELWGWRELERGVGGAEPAVLELERELVLRVRVLDATGKPVEGANVVLGDRNGTLRLGLTDRTGRARLTGIGRVLEHRSSDAGISLSIDVVAWEPPRVALDPAHLPSDEVELVLPPTGSLEVRFVGHDGDLLPVDAVVSLDALDPAAGPAGEGRGGVLRNGARAVGGIASFPLVAVGAWMQLYAAHSDGRPMQSEKVPGPARAGERVVFPIQVDTSLPKLVLHLAQPDGTPLAGARVTLGLGNGPGGSTRRTDDAGELYWFVTTQDAERLRSLRLSSSDGGRLLRATVALPTPLAGGENDLGRIALELVTPFAAGRVLGPDGAPVEGAEVTASERAGDAPSERLLGATKSREDGGFAFYDKLRGERLALSARMPGFAPARNVEVAPFQGGVELRMREPGSLAGTLLVDAAIEPRTLSIDLTCDDDGTARAWTTPISRDGAFAFHDLPAGLYELRASSAAAGSKLATLATIAGIVVVGGEETRDSRLAPWDLRGRITRIALDVHDPAGAPIDGLRAWLRRSGGEDAWTEVYAVDGSKVELTTAEPVLDVLLRAPRMLPLELTRLSASREVVMTSGPTLELVLEGGMPVLPPTARLTATLRSAAPDGGRALVQIAEFDRYGVARLDVIPDEEVRLSVHPKTVFGLGSSVLLEPKTITVPAAGDRVVVRIDPEALERALASLELR